jgi:hypothetical protein
MIMMIQLFFKIAQAFQLVHDSNGRINQTLLSLSSQQLTTTDALIRISQANKELEKALAELLAGAPSSTSTNLSSVLGSI